MVREGWGRKNKSTNQVFSTHTERREREREQEEKQKEKAIRRQRNDEKTGKRKQGALMWKET
jgi:hypothetical protein